MRLIKAYQISPRQSTDVGSVLFRDTVASESASIKPIGNRYSPNKNHFWPFNCLESQSAAIDTEICQAGKQRQRANTAVCQRALRRVVNIKVRIDITRTWIPIERALNARAKMRGSKDHQCLL